MTRLAIVAGFLIGSTLTASGAPSSGTIAVGEWAPSIIINVPGYGAVDLSSIMTPKRYEKKVDCEIDVRTAALSMRRLYPTVQIAFSACTRVPN
jgi:hypothetical protein